MKYNLHTVIFLLILFLFSCGDNDQTQLFVPKIPIFQTKAQQIPIYHEFVGQIYGYKDIAIRARVEGFLEGIHFIEGSTVEKGKQLYTLESQPFQADVAAKMSKVAEAKTMLAKAQSDLNRIKPLAEQKAVSQSDLDASIAQYEAAVASVEAAEANLRASEIQLSYTKIYSPISGIIGKTSAKVGDFVGRSPNTIILNVVSRIDTILVQFFLTETQYLQVARYLVSREDPISERNERVQLELILADGSLYPHKGKIDFVDREVDPTTGAILVQASFPNSEKIIRPGQFGKVKAKLLEVDDGIMIPQRCVLELQGIHSVFVVSDSNKVERREISVGQKINSFWIIREGLRAEEKVVYEGLQKVRSGDTVDPVIQEIELINFQKQ